MVEVGTSMLLKTNSYGAISLIRFAERIIMKDVSRPFVESKRGENLD